MCIRVTSSRWAMQNSSTCGMGSGKVFTHRSLCTRGVKNWEALRGICFENFEPWHQPDWRVERYYWVGNHSAMTLAYNKTLDQGQLIVYSKTIYERQLAQERQDSGPRPINRFRLY